MNKIVDCTAIAQKIKDEVKAEVELLGIKPCLAVVIVGDDPASKTYVRNKEKVCEEVGIESKTVRLSGDIDQYALETVVKSLNEEPTVHGILVQLPLPKHLDEQKVIDLIAPHKDVDGLTIANQGLLALGRLNEAIIPCTPAGVLRIFDEIEYDLQGKRVTIVGRSNLFGKPMAQLALSRNATVKMCHSKTDSLMMETSNAHVLICAIGQPKFIDSKYTDYNEVVVDVGINRDEHGKLCGDVDLQDVIDNSWSDNLKHITPVPRGAGVLTTAMLAKDVVKCFLKQI